VAEMWCITSTWSRPRLLPAYLVTSAISTSVSEISTGVFVLGTSYMDCKLEFRRQRRGEQLPGGGRG